MFMDRVTTNIASSQIGFIDFIIKPSFEVAGMLLPNIYRLNEGVENNKKEWEKRITEYIPEKKNNIKGKRPSKTSDQAKQVAKLQFDVPVDNKKTDSEDIASLVSSSRSSGSRAKNAPNVRTIELIASNIDSKR